MILNRQRSVRVSVGELDKFLERALRRLRLPPGALIICLVDNAKMAHWNRSYRGKKGHTDVLSFPINGAQLNASTLAKPNRPKAVRSSRSESYLGDIAISLQAARRNARRFTRPLPQELRLLILHGMLHLAGYDHETDHGEMDRIERRLRHRLGLS